MALGIFNALVHCTSWLGDDKVGLGRWCWAQLRGKGNILIHVVSIYRPCYPTVPQSTYQQQLFHPDHYVPLCPRVQFMVELQVEIKEWLMAREQWVIMGDFNTNTAQPAFKQCFQEVGLVDALAFLHGQLTWPMHNQGSFPIDAIYLSPGLLQGATGGYVAFEEGLLSNLHMEVLFGSREWFSWVGTAWQLKCRDPHVVAQYNQRLLVDIQQQGLVNLVCQLDQEGHKVKMADVD